MVRPIFAAMVVASLLISTATDAGANLDAFWQRNTITPQAVAADPTGVLANSQSWSLLVTHTDGDWAEARLRAMLPGGATFYNTSSARGGGNTKPSAQSISMFSDVAFDTYASGPAPEQIAVYDSLPFGSAISFGGPADPVPGTVAASWGDLVQTAPGTFEVVRLTFPANISIGDVHVQNDLPGGVADPSNSQTSQVGPDVTILVPSIPEPTLVGLLSFAALAGVRRAWT